MSAERILEDAREQVRKIVPSHINITSIDFEGPVSGHLYQDMEAFASNNDIVRQLAQGLGAAWRYDLTHRCWPTRTS